MNKAKVIRLIFLSLMFALTINFLADGDISNYWAILTSIPLVLAVFQEAVLRPRMNKAHKDTEDKSS